MISSTPLVILKEHIYRTLTVGLTDICETVNKFMPVFLITSEMKKELKITIVKVLDEMDYFCVLLAISVYTS